MPSLFVRCHACRTGFPSGIAHNLGTPDGLELLGILEECPRCRHLDRYNTPEFFVPRSSPRAVPVDRPRSVENPAPPPVAAGGNRFRFANLQL
ncbi:MAG TPA: hypothetical protein VEY07_09245 [Thermoplasmata archaeon]|nr:hypothetical protein [Thermoplasmata archaeon]